MSSVPAKLAAFGQLFMVGLPGPRLDPVAQELVRDLQVGGIILFARNIEGPEQVWELTRDLQREALAASGLPLLIAVDQEGGIVQRLKEPFTLIPRARELGLRATLREVEELSRKTAQELALVGINVNLAPVLDVARGPQCPLYERSYGSDPEQVAAFCEAAILGFLTGGVLPAAKHFPGLGDTLRDSHVELPDAQEKDPTRAVDLLPFRRAIAAGVPLIMTAHTLVPEWDSRPGTLSPVAIRNWLRQNLGFAGVVMTDDLEMGAIAEQTLAPQAARQALMAGADLLLICNNWQAAWDAARDLAWDQALEFRSREAAARLMALKTRLRPFITDRKDLKDYFRNA